MFLKRTHKLLVPLMPPKYDIFDSVINLFLLLLLQHLELVGKT